MPVLILFLILIVGPAGLAAAQETGPSGPAADRLNRIYSVGDKWALYGMPQAARLDRAAFDSLVAQVKDTKFSTVHTQVVVIISDSNIEGTIGLIEKRGLRVSSLYVDSAGSPAAYDVWHTVGYNTTPDRIYSDFQENIIYSENTYRDLPLTFNGTVRRVGKDEKGEVFIEFAVRTKVGLVCYPWGGAPQAVDLPALRSGDKLKVSGQFTEMLPEGPKLRGCLFSR